MLKSRNLSEEKKTHHEHKYSVTFVSKVGKTSYWNRLKWLNKTCWTLISRPILMASLSVSNICSDKINTLHFSLSKLKNCSVFLAHLIKHNTFSQPCFLQMAHLLSNGWLNLNEWFLLYYCIKIESQWVKTTPNAEKVKNSLVIGNYKKMKLVTSRLLLLSTISPLLEPP